MSQPIKTPKSVVITLVAGFGLGVIAMGTIQSGIMVHSAYADGPKQVRTVSEVSSESLAELHNLDSSFANLAEFVGPAVVDIRASSGRQMNANGQRIAMRQGEGSGFIFRQDGYIITNDHVVDGADKVKVILKDGREYDGTVIRAEDSDIAVVKINATGLPVLAFGDSSKLRPGQMCMAIGSPFGMENSVTFGHVSALGRATPIASDLQARFYPDLIQTDASINMGNSGGPLVNVDGQIIGVNTAIYSPTGTSAGIGFAIPSNQAKFIAEMLVSKGKVTRAYIGLVPENLKEFQKKDKNLAGGAVVSQLPEGPSPAKTAGLKVGDVIVKVGTTPITSQLDLRNAMLVYSPGTSIPVTYVRDGKESTVNVKLEAPPVPEKPRATPFDNGGGNGDLFENLPKGFDDFDLKPFRDRIRQQAPRQFDGEDVPALKSGKARLGVNVGTTTDELRKEFDIPASVKGAVVVEVLQGSVAESLGMKPGDVITQIGDKPVASSEELTAEISKLKWGDSTRIKFGRYGKGSVVQQDTTVTFK